MGEGNKSKIVIALLGVTGAGKTTFVSRASGRDDLKIGHGVDPCTQDPLAVDFVMDERKIVLIDTPGFDDDTRSDVEILEGIAKWMAQKGYLNQNLLDGLIFLHPITLNRVGGSERRRTRLLEKILGVDAYHRVIIATTMWEDLKFKESMEKRLEGRTNAGGVWHDMCSKGATLVKHENSKESAQNLIRQIAKIADKRGKVQPLLQKELQKTLGRVGETSAGKELEKHLRTDIKLIREQLRDHDDERPPAFFRNDKNSEHRKQWKEWHRERRMMQDRLDLREQQLKRLGSIVVRVKSFLSTLFG